MKKIHAALFVTGVIAVTCSSRTTVAAGETLDAQPAESRSRLRAVPFSRVTITGGFWMDRIDACRTGTIPACLEKCESTGRLANFARAGGLAEGEFEGIYYNDSDVYKVIEGVSYALTTRPDAALEARLDELIAAIAAAQQPDGYLNTYYTLVEPENRWSDLKVRHELYCAGHLFEAAAAHYRATGKRALLDVAVRFADHIDSVFGPGKRHDVPGHEEIELGLMKLADAVDEDRYRTLAKFFIDQRGRAEHRELYGQYCQDHAPVIDHDRPLGHAVRAMYLYCGMADVAHSSGDAAYASALDRIWDTQISSMTALTGGVGARRAGEAFGDPYELPNAEAYNETCAAIGSAFWNGRMHLLHGDARYIDVLERTLYNGVLSGVSLTGDRFFYPNPLASGGSYHRSEWFNTSCCPVNIVRVLPSIGGYLYTQDERGVYVNLFAESEASIEINDIGVTLRQQTDYPWSGEVKIEVSPEQPAAFDVCVRIPGWAMGRPIPGDLYEYVDPRIEAVSLSVNGRSVGVERVDRGYVRIHRLWRAGDVIELSLPMPVRVVKADERVEANRGRVAFERGPIVYCIEQADVAAPLRSLYVREDRALAPIRHEAVLDGMMLLVGEATVVREDEAGALFERSVPFTVVPYFAWDNRKPGAMMVWIPADPSLVTPARPATIATRSAASASHCYENDSVAALNDQHEPANSSDHSIARMTWWPHKGTREWVQFGFENPATIEAVEVYWFDDTGQGACRTPKSWRVMVEDRFAWRVAAESGAGVLDAFDRLEFTPVTTTGVRIEVDLQDGFSGGILELRVIEAK